MVLGRVHASVELNHDLVMAFAYTQTVSMPKKNEARDIGFYKSLRVCLGYLRADETSSIGNSYKGGCKFGNDKRNMQGRFPS